MANKYFEHFAFNLGDLYNQRAQLQIELAHILEDADARRLYMAPDEGWPGKNEEARKAARDKAFAEDAAMKKLTGRAADIKNELTLTDKDIAIWEVRFKAARWETREHLIEALRMVHGIAPEENNQASEGGFDDAADNASDQVADAQLEHALNNPPDDETAEMSPEEELFQSGVQTEEEVAVPQDDGVPVYDDYEIPF